MAATNKRKIRSILLLPIRAYKKFISPFLPPACIYYPSCSQYMEQAILQLGLAKGLILGLVRLSRCSGIAHGGIDFPPRRLSWHFVWPYIRKYWRRHCSHD